MANFTRIARAFFKSHKRKHRLAPKTILQIEALEARLLFTVSQALLNSWFVSGQSEYTQVISAVTGGTTSGPSTTWSGQTSPVLGDIQKVQYSTNGNYVYISTPDLASYTMGPWWMDSSKQTPFVNFPKDQHSTVRVALNTTYPSATHASSTNGPVGVAVNGVVFFNNGDAFSYAHASSADSPQGDGIFNRQAEWAESATFDVGNGHQPGNGQYHYHTDPPALRTQLNDNIEYVGSTDYFPYDPQAYYLTHGEGSDGTYIQNTTNLHHSPIIGWMYDGYPVYGPFGYSNPTDPTSPVVRMTSSYSLRSDLTTGSPRITVPGWSAELDSAKLGSTAAATAANALYTMTAAQQTQYAGPSVSATYPLGRYGEDYAYVPGSGSLDQFNGRWCVTPEFPNGTYAYFDTVDASGAPVFPYLMGRQYYGSAVTAGAVTSITESVTTSFDISTNTPPVVSGPGAATVVAGATFNFTGVNQIAVSDVDAAATESVALAVSGGTLTVDRSGILAGLTTIAAGANGSAALTLSGAITELNAALATLNFTAPVTATSVTLTARANDGSAANNFSNLLSTSISVTASTHLQVSTPASVSAGTVFTFSVSALDTSNNVATGYTGTVHLSTTDAQGTVSTDATLNAGLGTFAAVLDSAGVQTITAVDTVNAGVGGSNNITVAPRAANHFSLIVPANVAAGGTFPVTITARDSYNNTATGYTGTVHFASSDAAAALPADTTLTAGVGVFSSVYLTTAGLQTLTASDRSNPAIGASATASVSAGATTHFTVSAPANTTAGFALVMILLAKDNFNNIASNYSGTVRFSSTDNQASLPASATLSGGQGFFAAVLRTAGTQNLIATDTANNSLTGTSGTLTVSPAAASHFGVAAPAAAITGNPIALTVTALDAYGNTAPSYGGTVTFSSSDAAAALPSGGPLTAGAGTFSATLMAAGMQTITVTDPANPAMSGTSSAIVTHGLTVTSLTATASGFTAVFNKPFDRTQINLYDQAGLFGPDDVPLTGPSAPQISIHGSLLISDNNQTITFVKTGNFTGASFNPGNGVLVAGTYTVTFRSAANGFKDLLGSPLDGGNYVATFVEAAPGVAVGIPSFARGPDDAHGINLPNTLTTGIPLNVSAGSGITSGVFTLQYNSALLSVSSAAVNTGLAGAIMSLDATSTPGTAIIDFTSPAALTQAGVVRLGGLVATVPNSAASLYRSKALLHFSGVSLNGGAIATTAADAVEITSYFGDATGDGSLSGGDASAISTVATGNFTSAATGTLGGFAAFPLADPTILGDLNSNGNPDAPDVTLLNSFLSGTPWPQIPPIPSGLTIVPTGPDPSLSLPAAMPWTLDNGRWTVTVPLNIDTARPDGSMGATEVILALRYNPALLDVSAADIGLGSLTDQWAVGSGQWTVNSAVNPVTGEIGIDLVSNTPIQTSGGGSLVTIAMHAANGVAMAEQADALRIVDSVNPTGQRPYRTEVADAQGAMVLHNMATTLNIEPLQETASHVEPAADLNSPPPAVERRNGGGVPLLESQVPMVTTAAAFIEPASTPWLHEPIIATDSPVLDTYAQDWPASILLEHLEQADCKIDDDGKVMEEVFAEQRNEFLTVPG
jgi:hypothetical protein